MSREKRRELREHIRDEISFGFSQGGATTGAVTESIVQNHGALLKELGESLARSAVADLVRQAFRQAHAILNGERRQLDLPYELKDLDVPNVISIPRERSTDSEDDDTDADEDRVLWLNTTSATLAQAFGHLALLNDGIQRDVAKRDDWKDFCDYLMKESDGDLDAVIGDILSKAQAKPKKGRRRKATA